MVFDANVFIGESLYGNSFSIDDLKAVMKTAGVTGAIIRPLKPPDLDFDSANREIAALQENDDNLIGFARVNPLRNEAVEHARKAIREYGLKGIHLHPWEENFRINSYIVDKIVEVAEEEDVPLYISAGYPMVSHPLQVQELLIRHPGVTAIVTHGGQQDMSGLSFDDALIVAEETENVVFDVSGVYRRDFIELLVEKAGAERVILGSCTPYMNMRFEIIRIVSTHLSKEIKELILHKNIEGIMKKHQK